MLRLLIALALCVALALPGIGIAQTLELSKPALPLSCTTANTVLVGGSPPSCAGSVTLSGSLASAAPLVVSGQSTGQDLQIRGYNESTAWSGLEWYNSDGSAYWGGFYMDRATKTFGLWNKTHGGAPTLIVNDSKRMVIGSGTEQAMVGAIIPRLQVQTASNSSSDGIAIMGPNTVHKNLHFYNTTDDKGWVPSYRYDSEHLVFYYYNGSSWLTPLAISEDGNVGIGTTDPSHPLHILGSRAVITGGTTTQFVQYPASGGHYWDSGTVGLSTYIRTSNASALDTTAITISPAGNVGLSGVLNIGGGATTVTGTFPGTMETHKAAASNYGVLSTWSATQSHMPNLVLTKSASNTLGTMTATASGDYLGGVYTYGVGSGGTFVPASAILTTQTGSAGASGVPTTLGIYTATGSGWVQALSVLSSGNVKVHEDLVFSDDSVQTTAAGYALQVSGSEAYGPTDAATVYAGQGGYLSTTQGLTYLPIPKAGTIGRVDIRSYCTGAGSNENWSAYVRLNASSDTLIQTTGAAANARSWITTNAGVSVAAGDVIQIKFVNPTWGTNPSGCYFSGSVWIGL